MELIDLEAYLAVVEHNGFRRAAQALFVSQPSLTRRVARLEQELKVTLLERGRRGVQLTAEGEIFLSVARRVLAAVAEARASATGAWGDHIVLACTATAVGSFLTDFLVHWVPRHPKTRVRIVEDGPLHTRRRLLDHECDAAIVAAPLERDFDHLPITRAQVQALIPPGHRLTQQNGPLPVTELDGEPVMINGEQYLSGQLLRSACRIAGVRLEILLECSVGQTLAALVQAGLGVAVFSDAVDRRGYALPTRPLCAADGGLLEFDLRIAWSRHRALSPAVYEFVRDFSAFTRPCGTAGSPGPLGDPGGKPIGTA